ncbi:MAG: peptidase T [Spirochaetia bacterium]
MDLKADLLERFLRYVQLDTQVMPEYVGKRCPTNPKQLDFVRMLAQEISDMGIPFYSDEKGFLIARLKGTRPDITPIALMAHLDVAHDVPAEGVMPRVHTDYQGTPLTLEDGVVINPYDDPILQSHIGDTLVTSDGRTLLGADDKAGVAAIMSMLKYFSMHPEIPRGDVEAVFTPDEEGGDGMSHFPIKELHAKIAYTIDGGALGEVNYECYYAYTVKVDFTGVAIHPGTARGIMVNSLSMLSAFVSMIPRSESPEATDGYYGCYWPESAHGGTEKSTLNVMVRDHNKIQVERRLQALVAYAKAVEHAFPGGKVDLHPHLSYQNMSEAVQENKVVLERLFLAMEVLDIHPIVEPIRGGTDGARLTSMGVVCPNIFTGGHNMHSRKEWLSLNTLEKACQLAIELVKG